MKANIAHHYPDKSILLQNTNEKIKQKIIQGIKTYKKGLITLNELVSEIGTIKIQKQLSPSSDVKNALNEISSLSVIEDMLEDIVNELETNKER
jgi:hypothetical protein